MRPRRLKRLFQCCGAASLTAGAASALYGIWAAFFKPGRSEASLVSDLVSGAICLALAALLMRFGRDMIGYYRVK